MSRFLPETLKAQTLLILFSIFILSHVSGVLIYEMSRDRTVLLTEATDLAARIAGIVDLAHDFRDEQRQRILSAAETQFLAMFPDISFPPDVECQDNEFSVRMLEEFHASLSGISELGIEVCVRSLRELAFPIGMISSPGFDVLVYINFPDGKESVFHAVLPEAPSLFADIALAYIIFIGVISLLAAWYLIQRIITPLDRLAVAADTIGININASPLNEEGSAEIRTASRAFNRMQKRLRRLVQGQTETIAAISHDLRSAVTRLHLRAELLKDPEERDGFLRVVKDMNLMVQTVIDFVRGVDTTEQSAKIDVDALLESLCHDLAEEGYPVSYAGEDAQVSLECRPSALRRGVLNIINNAIKYGQEARISLIKKQNKIIIRIDDDGPGLPDEEMTRITRPFYRVEHSRNPDTGGVGLGLAIAQNIIQLHGGRLRFQNRPEGGFRVVIILNTLNYTGGI